MLVYSNGVVRRRSASPNAVQSTDEVLTMSGGPRFPVRDEINNILATEPDRPAELPPATDVGDQHVDSEVKLPRQPATVPIDRP